MTRIWGHFVILVWCELVTFKPQIMLNTKNKILITVAIMQKIDFFPIPVLSQLGGPSSKTEASLSKGFQAFISLKGGSRAAKTT